MVCPVGRASRRPPDATKARTPNHQPSTPFLQVEVIVHPLVLLSTVDHYNRVAKDTRKRVVGVLLGTTYKGRIDITNSFAGARQLLGVIGGGGGLSNERSHTRTPPSLPFNKLTPSPLPPPHFSLPPSSAVRGGP